MSHLEIKLRSLMLALFFLLVGFPAKAGESPAFRLYFVDGTKRERVSIPHIWGREPRFTNQASGHYQLVIDGPIREALSLRINGRFTLNPLPYQVFMQGTELLRCGDPAEPDNLRENIIPAKPISLPPQEGSLTLDIFVQRNSSSLWPGIHQIEIMTKAKADQQDFLQTALATAMLGALLLVGLYHTMLWVLHRNDYKHLLFTLFCGCVALFTLLHVSNFLYLMVPVSVQNFWALQALAWYGAMTAFDVFSFVLFPTLFPKRKVIATTVLSLMFWGLIWVHLYSMFGFQLYSWYYLIQLTLFIRRLPKQGERKNQLYTGMYLLLIAGTLLDLASGLDLLQFPSLLPYFFFGMVLVEAFLLSYLNQQTSLRLLHEQMMRVEVEESLHAVQSIRDRLNCGIPQIPHIRVQTTYRPAAKFGGDWLSLTYQTGDRHAILLVGDVTGHGIGSGLMSVTIGATIHGALSTMEQLSESFPVERKLEFLARAINEVVVDISRRLNKGMTLALVGFDFERQICVIRNHGHPFPYLIRDHKVKVLIARGELLGLNEDPQATVSQIPLQKGDRLFVYTDGLIENSDAAGQMLPRRELEKALAGLDEKPETLASFEEFIHAASGDTEEADDLAFMLVEWIETAS